MSVPEAARVAGQATREILAAIRAAPRGVVVDSPPGAGKSTLVVQAAADLVAGGHRVMVIAQTNEQVDDLTDALARSLGGDGDGGGADPGGGGGGGAGSGSAGDNSKRRSGADPGGGGLGGDPGGGGGGSESGADNSKRRSGGGDPGGGGGAVRVGRLTALGHGIPGRVSRHASVTSAATLGELVECQVVLSTAHKWAGVRSDEKWPWAIVDEAYQMRSDLLLRVAGLFERALFVGDPGQLDPFSVVEVERWLGLSWDPTLSAVEVILRHNRDIPVLRLPVSWRLPASAAPVISRAFYPFSPFTAATSAGERALAFQTAAFGRGALDNALDVAARSGWALYELPGGHKPRTDAEATAACAALAARLLERRAIATSERSPEGSPVTADRIAVGVSHRDQAAAVRAELERLGVAGVTADTANRLQGREFDVTIVLHPLSGRRDATAFHLEAGRLCVLTSRHRHACVVVARAGIPQLLDAHPSVEPVHLNVPVKFPDGWEAQHSLLAHLEEYRVPAG